LYHNGSFLDIRRDKSFGDESSGGDTPKRPDAFEGVTNRQKTQPWPAWKLCDSQIQKANVAACRVARNSPWRVAPTPMLTAWRNRAVAKSS
jgi:hypothetical protein